VFTSALLGLMLATPATAGPLTPAMAGQRLCMAPNPDQKTCAQLDSFKPTAEGTFVNVSDMRIPAGDGIISYTLTTSAVVRGEDVCSTLLRKHLQAARFKVAGMPLSAALAADLRRAVEGALSDYLNKESCMTFEETPEGLVARAKVNGVRDSGLDIFVKWVDPSEGYHLMR